jgi:hypothetical protein
MTFEEYRGTIESKTVTWTGDDARLLSATAHRRVSPQLPRTNSTAPSTTTSSVERLALKLASCGHWIGSTWLSLKIGWPSGFKNRR